LCIDLATAAIALERTSIDAMPLYLEAPPIMLALPFHHANLFLEPPTGAGVAELRAAALPDSLVSLALRSVLR
jgi:hypothetical protein